MAPEVGLDLLIASFTGSYSTHASARKHFGDTLLNFVPLWDC
jgi:hypothetical protein